jgi:hypothetical protein
MPPLDDKPVPFLRRPVPLWATVLLFLGGGALGFGGGVASVKAARDFFRSLSRVEQRADVATRRSVNRPGFRFDYPGNWKLDTDDADHDPDHSFSINSPGQSLIMFLISDSEADAKGKLEKHVAAQLANTMKDAKRTAFDRWGRHHGEGALLSGRYIGFTQGTIRIFVFAGGGRTYTIVQSTYDDDRANVEPGFRLIEQTFQVKDAPPPPAAPEK